MLVSSRPRCGRSPAIRVGRLLGECGHLIGAERLQIDGRSSSGLSALDGVGEALVQEDHDRSVASGAHRFTGT